MSLFAQFEYTTFILFPLTYITIWYLVVHMFDLPDYEYQYLMRMGVLSYLFILVNFRYLLQLKEISDKFNKFILLSMLRILYRKDDDVFGQPPTVILAAVNKYKNIQCVICLKSFREDASFAITALSCGHCYHKPCLSSWETEKILSSNLKCIICQQPYNKSNKWHYKYTKGNVSKGHLEVET
eukprot:664230_1